MRAPLSPRAPLLGPLHPPGPTPLPLFIQSFKLQQCGLQATRVTHKHQSRAAFPFTARVFGGKSLAALSLRPVEFGTDALGVFALLRRVSNGLAPAPLHSLKQHCVTLLDAGQKRELGYLPRRLQSGIDTPGQIILQ